MLLEDLALVLSAADPVDLQVREGEETLFITDLCCLKAMQALALAAADPVDLQVREGEERLFITDLC